MSEVTSANLTPFDHQQEIVTQQSSSAEHHGRACLPFHEAVTKLPVPLQPEDNNEREELAKFLLQVDQPYKGGSGSGVTARSVLNYIHRILEVAIKMEEVTSQGSQSNASDRIPELHREMTYLTGKVACEIASNVTNGIDSHNITLLVLNTLESFSWETKAAIIAVTFILTFGDKGLNLCPQSNLSFDDVPKFVKDILEIMKIVVDFESLPTIFMTSQDPEVMKERTNFIVFIYWIIRNVVDTIAYHIMERSSRGIKLGTATTSSPPSSKKLKAINELLWTTLSQLNGLLGNNIDIEVYENIKRTIQEEDHSDNMNVLNVLISTNDDTPQLYDGLNQKKVVLNSLQGKSVLLLLLGLDMVNELRHIDKLFHDIKATISLTKVLEENISFEMVLIPITDRLIKLALDKQSMFHSLKSEVKNGYSVDHLWMIKNEVIKFFRDDWNFRGEPMIVVLDHQGKVVNQNAIHMLYIWGNNAFPFTKVQEENLWKQETWQLELLFDKIDEQVFEWIRDDKYIFLFGGEDIEWIRSLTKMIHSVAITGRMPIPLEVLYVGKSYNNELFTMVRNCIMKEKLSKLLYETSTVWYFWKRIESMIYSMVQMGKVDDVFQEIQRLHNHEKSNVEWVILAKGSKILVNGRGQIALSTLMEYKFWKDQIPFEGFGVGFKSHYNKLYRKKFPSERIEFPAAAIRCANGPTTMVCPNCQREMNKYRSFLCYHPLSRRN